MLIVGGDHLKTRTSYFVNISFTFVQYVFIFLSIVCFAKCHFTSLEDRKTFVRKNIDDNIHAVLLQKMFHYLQCL